ncbi:receptor-type tyrosine-protein phosphatase O-like [Aplochiton taeniatus]
MSGKLINCIITITTAFSTQSITSFKVTVRDEDWIVATLEPLDLRENVTVYAARFTGQPRTHLVQFQNLSDPAPLVFNASHHGSCYTVGLLVKEGKSWSKPVKTVTVLTKPLPVDNVVISDYKESPETGVVFEISSPANNVFSRVNISFLEGKEPHSMLYKDFYKGKTVFKHWLPGTCYSNITFQLISEATVNKSTLVRGSEVTHDLRHHRTVPNPPLNISRRIVHLSQTVVTGDVPETDLSEGTPGTLSPRKVRDVPLMEEQVEEVEEGPSQEQDPASLEEAMGEATQVVYTSPQNFTETAVHYTIPNDNINTTARVETVTQPRWPEPTGSPPPTEGEDGFVNALVPEYEDSNEPGSAMGLPPEPTVTPTKLPPILLELRWLPPRPPTASDGFNVYIYRDGNSTETATVDENTHEFFTELTEPGTYRVLVTTLSSSGLCEPRESTANTGFTFYFSPTGELLEQPMERPQAVSVRLLGSSTAVVSWGPSAESHNGSLVSVVSLTCMKPSISQRMESTYCSEENTTSEIINNLTPGAQYRVVVYHTNGPLISPPSEPVIIDIGYGREL